MAARPSPYPTKEDGSSGTDRGLFQIVDSWTLGWNDSGEWQNYTREFPGGPNNYRVFGHFASGAFGIKVRVDQIVAGQGLQDSQQVKTTLGYFDPGRTT